MDEPLIDIPAPSTVRPRFFTPISRQDTEALVESHKESLADESQLDASTSVYWIHKNMMEDDFTKSYVPDPEWDMSKEEYEKLTEGIHDEYLEEFGDAVNAEHAQQIRSRLLSNQQADEIINRDGILEGVGWAMLASFSDPSAWAITAATEGLAAPYMAIHKGGRIARIAKSGFLSAGSNIAVESILANYSPTIDEDDILYAGAAGFILGGGIRGVSDAVKYRGSDLELETAINEAVKKVEREQEFLAIYNEGLELSDAGKEYFKDFVNAEGKPKSPETLTKRSLDDFEDTAGTFGSAFRIDRGSVVFSSELEGTRKLASAMMHDSAGKGAQTEDAFTWKEIHFGRNQNDYMKSQQNAYSKWLQEQGKTAVGKNFRNRSLNQFEDEVYKAVVGIPSESPAINAHASKIKTIIKDYGDYITDPKKGELNRGNAVSLANPEGLLDEYGLPQIHSKERYLEYIRRHSREDLERLLAKSMDDILEETDRLALARHVIKSVTSTKNSQGFNIKSAFGSDDLDDLVSRLEAEETLTRFEINDIINILKGKSDEKVEKGQGGKPSRLKHRISFDRTDEEFLQLLDTNTTRLMLNYMNSMSGHIALARQGIGSKADFNNLLEETAKELDEKVTKVDQPKAKKMADRWSKRERPILEAAYDNLTGKPLSGDPAGNVEQWSRILGKYNYSVLMNQMGATQLGELGVVVATKGFYQTLRHVPELGKMFRRLKTDSSFADELLEELTSLTGGWGGERLTQQVSNRIDDQGTNLAPTGTVKDKIENFLDHTARITSDISGFTLVDHLLKNLQLKASAQTFADMAKLDASDLSKVFQDSSFNKRAMRFADIGITKDNFKPIARQLKKHTEFSSSGKIEKLNLEKWNDLDALNTFQIAMRLDGERSVLTPSFADLPAWGTGTALGMEGVIGRALWQFKRFIAVAQTKLLMNGFKYRDVQTFTTFASASVSAGLVIALQTLVNAQGREDKARYIEDRLSPENLGKAIFQRSAWAGLMPMAVDIPFGLAGNPQFAYRSSGLGADPITGTPVFSSFIAARSLTQGAFKSATDPSYEFSQQDMHQLKRLTMFQNAFVINNAWNTVKSELPKYSQD